ncbi:MAG: hypothetical protein LUG18_13970 [Candidatus Azobacteroides sp.]|nr:hypothetical protein [Candidatus Azobacteroides sp.]
MDAFDFTTKVNNKEGTTTHCFEQNVKIVTFHERGTTSVFHDGKVIRTLTGMDLEAYGKLIRDTAEEVSVLRVLHRGK